MSWELRILLKNLRGLSGELLPPVNPTASYSQGEIVRMYAFRLLAHAEIEGYVEDLAEELATALATRNKANRLSAKVTARLLHHTYLADSYPPRSITKRLSPKDSQKAITQSLNSLQAMITSNNGVSEKDVLKLFLPLGVDLSFFDEDWLRAMNELAAARGEVAHRSWITSSTIVQPDPQSERQRLVVPILGLRNLTVECERLIAAS